MSQAYRELGQFAHAAQLLRKALLRTDSGDVSVVAELLCQLDLDVLGALPQGDAASHDDLAVTAYIFNCLRICFLFFKKSLERSKIESVNYFSRNSHFLESGIR